MTSGGRCVRGNPWIEAVGDPLVQAPDSHAIRPKGPTDDYYGSGCLE